MAVRQRSRPRSPWLALMALAGISVAGAACGSSDDPATQVRGVTVSAEEPHHGGPSAAVEAFRAGERAVYGTGAP